MARWVELLDHRLRLRHRSARRAEEALPRDGHRSLARRRNQPRVRGHLPRAHPQAGRDRGVQGRVSRANSVDDHETGFERSDRRVVWAA